ncbi:hypothetical protein MP638_006054 [Amoeboaphelidium occidentale]|nr:hypothetical protein MP638_006054 [Amoeboaphelidium occidentale]
MKIVDRIPNTKSLKNNPTPTLSTPKSLWNRRVFVSRPFLLYTLTGAVVGGLVEYVMVKFDVYDHMRLAQSRERLEEREIIDAAVDRIISKYPAEVLDGIELKRRWFLIKDLEDRLERGEIQGK